MSRVRPGIEEILYLECARQHDWSRGPKANEGGEEIKDGIEAGRKRVCCPLSQTVRFGRTREGRSGGRRSEGRDHPDATLRQRNGNAAVRSGCAQSIRKLAGQEHFCGHRSRDG